MAARGRRFHYRRELLPSIFLGLALVCMACSLLFFRPRDPTAESGARSASRMMLSSVGPTSFDLADFGGVGDGESVNTAPFERAVAAIARRGGGRLYVGPGTWLTGPFNLTSDMTLFLDHGAVVLGTTEEDSWPLMPPLPSYGVGREHEGPRYGSLIHGQNLKNVVITGRNGTIDGQGRTWWTKYQEKLLHHTRGPLLQLMWSRDIVISNVTLRNSPFWTLHPYACKNVTISDVTILAPVVGAPNTDGIDPDSCEDVLVENCYISVGDDGIAIKSGWDQYGIRYGRPSTNIVIRNLTVRSKVSGGVSIGSEMSGGVSNVLVEDLRVWGGSRQAIRIKTAPGRGGYIRNVTYQNLHFDDILIGIAVITDYSEHPDEGFDPAANPVIENITFAGVRGKHVRVPVRIHGSRDIPVKGITFRNVVMGLHDSNSRAIAFQCAYVEGRAIGNVFPEPCTNLDRYSRDGRLMMRAKLQNTSNIIHYDH